MTFEIKIKKSTQTEVCFTRCFICNEEYGYEHGENIAVLQEKNDDPLFSVLCAFGGEEAIKSIDDRINICSSCLHNGPDLIKTIARRHANAHMNDIKALQMEADLLKKIASSDITRNIDFS